VADDFLCNAPQKSPFDATAAVATDDNEIGPPLLGGVDDFRSRFASLDELESLQPIGQMSTEDR